MHEDSSFWRCVVCQQRHLCCDIIHGSFYVNDCLTYARSKEEVQHFIHGTRSVLGNGGFNLTKFVVNDPVMLEDIVPPNHRAKEVTDLNPSEDSKALGIKWCVSSDCFYFQTTTPDDHVPSKGDVLSFVASVFDPLGLISPVVVKGKMIFQQATRMKIGWDEHVHADVHMEWKSPYLMYSSLPYHDALSLRSSMMHI